MICRTGSGHRCVDEDRPGRTEGVNVSSAQLPGPGAWRCPSTLFQRAYDARRRETHLCRLQEAPQPLAVVLEFLLDLVEQLPRVDDGLPRRGQVILLDLVDRVVERLALVGRRGARQAQRRDAPGQEVAPARGRRGPRGGGLGRRVAQGRDRRREVRGALGRAEGLVRGAQEEVGGAGRLCVARAGRADERDAVPCLDVGAAQAAEARIGRWSAAAREGDRPAGRRRRGVGREDSEASMIGRVSSTRACSQEPLGPTALQGARLTGRWCRRRRRVACRRWCRQSWQSPTARGRCSRSMPASLGSCWIREDRQKGGATRDEAARRMRAGGRQVNVVTAALAR